MVPSLPARSPGATSALSWGKRPPARAGAGDTPGRVSALPVSVRTRAGLRGTVAGCRRWETGPRTARLTPLILGAALALAGCASSAHLGKPGPAQGGSGCAPATGAGAGPGTCPTQTAPAAAGSSPQPSPSLSSSGERNWPSLVVEIMSYAQWRTQASLWAPAAPRVLPQPRNSAEVRVGESMYVAQLFACPQPQPLN